jgi:hypothetical protein
VYADALFFWREKNDKTTERILFNDRKLDMEHFKLIGDRIIFPVRQGKLSDTQRIANRGDIPDT